MSVPNPQEILDNTEQLLRGMELDAAELRKDYSAEEVKRLIAILSQHIQDAANVTSKEALLQLASNMQSALERDPAWREEFMGDIDPQAEEKSRHLTIEDVLAGTRALPSNRAESKQLANRYATMAKKVIRLLQDEQEEQNAKKEKEPK